jgi:hypothetical protein
MTRSEHRWTYPTEGEDPRAYDNADRLAAEIADRQISHDQGGERTQGLSSDKPGIDLSEREAVEHLPTGQTYAQDPNAKQDAEPTD